MMAYVVKSFDIVTKEHITFGQSTKNWCCCLPISAYDVKKNVNFVLTLSWVKPITNQFDQIYFFLLSIPIICRYVGNVFYKIHGMLM